MSALLHNYVIVGAILFGLGAIGFLTRRNLIVMFLCVEMMLQGVALNLVAFGDLHKNFQGQSFIVFMLTVAACEAAMALAVFLVLYRSRRTLDVSVWQELRDPGQEPIHDTEALPFDPASVPQDHPRLIVAGVMPEPLQSTEAGSDAAGADVTEEVTRV